MLRLPSTEPAWLDLPQGARIQHRPAQAADIAAAQAWTRHQIAAENERRASLLGLPEMPEDEARGARYGYFAVALARLCVTAWEGVDAEFSAENVGRLMVLPGMAAAYLPAALGLDAALSAEGNASAPAPSGTSAGAPTTAEGAESQATAASPA